MIKPSTFSIVAYDPATKAFGVAVASKFLSVGAVVPWLAADSGAVASQSYANTHFGSHGLPLLAGGMSAREMFDRIAATDNELQSRQVGIVDLAGESYSFTGTDCHAWAGGISGPGYAIQGNILVGEQVVRDMEAAFLNASGDFADRLFAALSAGDAAGGDKRGRQSASLRVVVEGGGYGGFSDNYIDFRVDNDPNPIQKIGEMMELRKLYYGTSDQTDKVSVNDEFISNLTPILIKRGFLPQPSADTTEFTNALTNFIGCENFEDRYDFENHRLDKPVYDFILKNY